MMMTPKIVLLFFWLRKKVCSYSILILALFLIWLLLALTKGERDLSIFLFEIFFVSKHQNSYFI